MLYPKRRNPRRELGVAAAAVFAVAGVAALAGMAASFAFLAFGFALLALALTAAG